MPYDARVTGQLKTKIIYGEDGKIAGTKTTWQGGDTISMPLDLMSDILIENLLMCRTNLLFVAGYNVSVEDIGTEFCILKRMSKEQN